MHGCIAIYPCAHCEEMTQVWEKYISLAKSYGWDEIFTTLHLPELTLLDQLNSLFIISGIAAKYGMSVQADISGKQMEEILASDADQLLLESCNVSWFRLDYGCSMDLLGSFYRKISFEGVVLNASLLDKEELESELHAIHEIDASLKVKACHNYYPRPETGLSASFAIAQTKLFQEKGIEVCWCIPSYDHPRGPVFAGLPTLENHRNKREDAALLDLIMNYHCSYVMCADEFLQEEAFLRMHEILSHGIVTIPVHFMTIKEEEKKIVLQTHQFRYDSSSCALRSLTSREMASFSQLIPPDLCIERKRGCITIDNENYSRYSGEMQVVMENLPADARVNVVGTVEEDALDLLKNFRYRLKYRFIEKKQQQ